MTPDPLIIFDFDSTFVKVETIDTLAEIAYAGDPKLDIIKKHVEELTRLSMTGECSLHDALAQRIHFLKFRKKDVLAVINYLKEQITTSFFNNRDFIRKNAKNIYIFSGGFSEIIGPVIKDFSIPKNHIYANAFIYDDDLIVGVDDSRFMAHGDGKAKQLQALNPKGEVYIIGDGSTDAAAKKSGLVTTFYLFTENVRREALLPVADKVIHSLDDFIDDFENKKNIKTI